MALKSIWVKSLALPLISQVGFRLLVYLVHALFFFIIKYKIGVYIMPTSISQATYELNFKTQ